MPIYLKKKGAPVSIDYAEIPFDYKFCNCAGCGKLLFGASCKDLWRPGHPPVVKARIDGRPYCPSCAVAMKECSAALREVNGGGT